MTNKDYIQNCSDIELTELLVGMTVNIAEAITGKIVSMEEINGEKIGNIKLTE